VDASSTKVHFIQTLFHELARQLDWDQLAGEYLKSCLEQIGAASQTSFPICLNRLVMKDGSTTPVGVADRLQSMLSSDIAEDYAMSHEFRTAVLHLCLAQVEREDGPVSPFGPAVARWLRGETTHLSEIKDAKLFQKVARNNARHLLLSLTHMIRKVGRRGTFILIDISRYLESNKFAARVAAIITRRPQLWIFMSFFGNLLMGKQSLRGVFIVILATPALLSDSYRSLDRYQALKMRIVDDVRVRSRQNLLAPMVKCDRASTFRRWRAKK
jgi:hypothetical protein